MAGLLLRLADLSTPVCVRARACDYNMPPFPFLPLMQVNAVYTLANGKLKVANKQFSSCNSDYEISFGSDADIRLCAEDESIKTVSFNFRRFDMLEHAEPNSTVHNYKENTRARVARQAWACCSLTSCFPLGLLAPRLLARDLLLSRWTWWGSSRSSGTARSL
jgi:hypothetical protein